MKAPMNFGLRHYEWCEAVAQKLTELRVPEPEWWADSPEKWLAQELGIQVCFVERIMGATDDLNLVHVESPGGGSSWCAGTLFLESKRKRDSLQSELHELCHFITAKHKDLLNFGLDFLSWRRAKVPRNTHDAASSQEEEVTTCYVQWYLARDLLKVPEADLFEVMDDYGFLRTKNYKARNPSVALRADARRGMRLLKKLMPKIAKEVELKVEKP